MNQVATNDPTYVLGHPDTEATRLAQHAELFAASMRRLLTEAGIATCMSVLDVGSGSGDVAMLAAEIVEATGGVLSIDGNPAVVSTARAHALDIAQLAFTTVNIREVERVVQRPDRTDTSR